MDGRACGLGSMGLAKYSYGGTECNLCPTELVMPSVWLDLIKIWSKSEPAAATAARSSRIPPLFSFFQLVSGQISSWPKRKKGFQLELQSSPASAAPSCQPSVVSCHWPAFPEFTPTLTASQWLGRLPKTPRNSHKRRGLSRPTATPVTRCARVCAWKWMPT